MESEKREIMKGILITFEGIDGCGKSTQAVLLRDRLSSLHYPVRLLREPGGTTIGERIRGILLDASHTEMSVHAELFLYLASRAQITAQCILPALQSGEIVILDRFIDSTAAYQGFARGLGLECVRYLNGIATSGLVPDSTFLFDCDPGVAASRRNSPPDRLESEGLCFMEKVREGFLSLSRLEPDRIHVLNGEDTVQLLSDSVFEHVKTLLETKSLSDQS